MTSKQIFMANMNALADSINTKANTVGKKTIAELKVLVDNLNVGEGYDINVDITHGTSVGATQVPQDTQYCKSEATIILTASEGYALPPTISVTNATYTYSSETGVIKLTNVTNDVVITIVCTLDYEYTQEGDDVKIINAPYTQNGDDVKIL